MSERIPCIKPGCRRTAAAEKYAPGAEIICAKCFRALPESFRKEHRRCWREIRKWERRIAKTSDEIRRQKMHRIRRMWCARLNRGWDEMRATLETPQRPEGIDAFLEEVGLSHGTS